MDMKQYMIESARTSSNPDLDKSLFNNNDSELLDMTLDVVQGGATADLIKRGLFYHDKQLAGRGKAMLDRFEKMYNALKKDGITLDPKYNELLHSILGIASEASEMMEELINASIEGRDVNKINMREELGDVMWYEALGLRNIGSTFEEAADFNIAKLKKRYPDKFTSEAALNRDLAGEHDALKGYTVEDA